MDEFEKLKDKLYEEMLEGELQRLEWQRRHDPSFGLHEVKIKLDTECKFQDEGWSGRGGIQHLEGQAKVSALEIFYHRLLKEAREGAASSEEE